MHMRSPIWQIEVYPIASTFVEDPRGKATEGEIHSLGWSAVPAVVVTDVYYLQSSGDAAGGSASLDAETLTDVAQRIFADPVTQRFRISRFGGEGESPESLSGEREGFPEGWTHRATVLKRPGVMDPVEASAVHGLTDLDIDGVSVRTAQRFYLFGKTLENGSRQTLAAKVLSNPVIEEVVWEDDASCDARAVPVFSLGSDAPDRVEKTVVPLRGKKGEELLAISEQGQLSLNVIEMEAIRDHFDSLDRDPTDIELETLAQTWSEHCCHKTFTGLIELRRTSASGEDTVETIDNLLKATIRRATESIDAPWCLSVFHDNAGVVAFDETYGITFKVETHNHPSAIEPYGGAGTGIGGVIRDTLGTGLGARPIVNTDVFCFGPVDFSWDELPTGTLHPLRVLRGVVSGVRDYGNRMGIPTSSGALYFDERYVGNPLVYAGSVGILPRDCIDKEVQPGDRIYALGGRTGRDGIHGATFSSVELTEDSEEVSSGAVQIGNAITEKKVLDVLLEARDRGLFRCVTDCGAGGFSSAVGEMGEEVGARVALERVPLKYHGLTYTEIWISEAQERMVIAVPPDKAAQLEELAADEEVECTDIGEFTGRGRLELFHGDVQVGDLDMNFLHGGIPRVPLAATTVEVVNEPARYPEDGTASEALHRLLAAPNIASKEWVVRQYDHEVQGNSVLKPMQGAFRDGPGDGVAFTPRFDSDRAIVIGCGMNPCYGDQDPYRMALSAVDEAMRNVVAAGGDPDRTALLDNFSWGNTRRPEVLGQLVEAARGCHDAAVAFRTPFVSGKDSLNNEFRVGERVISIPPTLLISSLAMVDSAHDLVSMDFKRSDSAIVLVGETGEELGGSHYFRVCGGGGSEVPNVDLPRARELFRAVHHAIRNGLVLAAHDLSEGGLAGALAEMAFAGDIGCEVDLGSVPGANSMSRNDAILFSESNSRFILEVDASRLSELLGHFEGLPAAAIGRTVESRTFRASDGQGNEVLNEELSDLKAAWKSLSEFLSGDDR